MANGDEPERILQRAFRFHLAQKILKSSPNDQREALVPPVCVLEAFTIKLMLKCLIRIEGGSPPQIHDLLDLFNRLREPTRQRLEAMWSDYSQQRGFKGLATIGGATPDTAIPNDRRREPIMSVTSAQAESAFQGGATTNIRWTHVAPTLLIIWIVSMFDKSNMAIVMNDQNFLNELGLAGQQGKLGWLSSGLFLAYGICAPLWGWVVDRVGARRTCALSLIVWALTCFWSGVAADYDRLLWSRIVLGAGEAVLYPFTLAVVANWFALKERGRATSFWWIGTMIGPMLVGLVITGVILAVGWRWQFHAMGILALILPLPMVWFLITDHPQEHRSTNAAEIELIVQGALENNEGAPGKGAEISR